MKNSISYLLIALFISCSLSAQVKIGNNPQNLDPSSVLELESTDKVLVITRVTTAQMNAIVPLQGALAYNTDLQSVHYYDGTQWVNIGGSGGGAGGPFTTDPIVNSPNSTIVITPLNGGSNFEVAPNSIRTEQIVDGGINGVDIQDGSIGPGKLRDNSVTEEKLSENSVGAFALDNDNIGVSAFINDVPFLTAGDINIVSGDAGNSLEARADGVFYNLQPLFDDIQQNTADILNATDDQNLTLTGNLIEIEDGNTIDLTPILGSGGGNQNLGQVLTQGNDGGAALIKNILDPVDPQDAATKAYVDANGGGGNQNLGQVLTQGNDAGAALIKNVLNPVDPQDAATRAYVDAAVTSEGTLADGTILIGDASNAAQQLALSGDATMDNTGALTIADDAIDSIKIEDFSITANDLNNMGATTDGEILQWDTTANADAGGWVIANNSGGHSGTAKSIFFAAADGSPTTADDNTNPNDDGGFIWDTDARQIGSNSYGALHIGLQAGSPPVGNYAKVVIAERIGNSHPQQGLAFPLQIQNENGSAGGASTGILFAVEPQGGFGKGGLVYERKGAWGVGDFHFLQNTVGDNTIPTLADKVFTIENDGDIVLAGDLIARNGPGAIDQVLTRTAAGTEWAAAGGGGGTPPTDTDSNDGLTDFNATTGYDLNVDDTTIELATDALQIKDGGITTAKIQPVTPAPATDQMLITDTSGAVVWTPVSGGGSIPTGTVGSIFFSDGAGGLLENNANLFWDQSFGTGGGLGIGTNSPSHKLHVAGNVRFQGILNSPAGSATNPTYRFNTDENTGMFRDGADELVLVAGATEGLRIDEAGNETTTTIPYTLELDGRLLDINQNSGGVGQVLTSTNIGTEWKEPAAIAMGKANGAVSMNINGIHSISGAAGINTVNFISPRPDNDYIIQLTVVGNNRIYVTSQLVGSFTVEIRSNADGSLVVAEWYFTILDF